MKRSNMVGLVLLGTVGTVAGYSCYSKNRNHYTTTQPSGSHSTYYHGGGYRHTGGGGADHDARTTRNGFGSSGHRSAGG